MLVTLVQKKHVLADKEKNLELIKDTVKTTDSDMFVFPELFLTGYSLKDRLWEEAEEIPGDSSQALSDLAVEQDCSLICGMPEKVPNGGRLFNSAVLVTPDGDIQKYRKTYLANFGPFDEMRYFEPDDSLPVINTPVGKVGIAICYDIFFPEITKSYAMRNIDAIIVISASPSTTRKYFEKVLPARAVETTSYIFYSNLVGREDGITFWGGDSVISPKGTELDKGKYYQEDELTEKVEDELLESARRGRPAISDTRPQVLFESADTSIR